MLDGYRPWPEDRAATYAAQGYWENITVADMVLSRRARFGARTALVAGDLRWSYDDLGRRVERLAAGLHGLGLGAGDRVVVQLPNIPEFVVAYLALTRLGAIPVLALRAHRETEVRHFLTASGARAYIIPDIAHGFDYRPMADALRPACPALERVLVVGTPGPGQESLSALIDAPLPEATVRATLAAIAPDPADVATLLLSGGTTSLSKLIPRSHNDYVLNARLCGAAAGFGPDTVFLAILPLGHNYNLASPGMLGTFYHGGTVVLAPAGDAATVFSLVERERVTVIAAVVPLITQWLAGSDLERFDTASLKIIQNGGARLAPELRARLKARLGCFPQEIYGTAEGLINMTRLDDPEDLVLNSSGSPVCEADEIKVLDENDREVPDGTPGELVTRGPYTINGYYNAGTKNAEAFTANGFYRMGDIVTKRGRHIFAEGRKKDLINRGGEKISCEEVENLILQHPAVQSVALVAMPDPVFGEKACAFVIPRAGQTVTFDGLVAFLRSRRIASFKLPERLEVVDAFPLSPVGKILKRQLRDMISGKV